MIIFNRNRYIALIGMLIGSSLLWYNTILLTNNYQETYLPIPNKTQLIGLLLGFIITILYWLKQCMTIIPS